MYFFIIHIEYQNTWSTLCTHLATLIGKGAFCNSYYLSAVKLAFKKSCLVNVNIFLFCRFYNDRYIIVATTNLSLLLITVIHFTRNFSAQSHRSWRQCSKRLQPLRTKLGNPTSPDAARPRRWKTSSRSLSLWSRYHLHPDLSCFTARRWAPCTWLPQCSQIVKK